MDRSGKRRARGATRNPAGRYVAHQTVPFDDGWGSLEEPALDSVPTVVHVERARSVISRNTSPDVPFSASINPYRGCEHGCIYCYARPSHAYLDHSPGVDFESILYAKTNAADMLREALRRRGYQPETITIGANTDPYQPIEKTYEITRRLLGVADETGHPVAIITKSSAVLRDLDVLGRLAARNLIRVYVSLTTLETELSRVLEPRASSPARRLAAIRGLAESGVPVSVMLAPMIPAINDHEVEGLITAATEAGAQSASYILLRLPREVQDLFVAWLDENFPQKKAKVLGLIRETRAGELNESRFGARMRGRGVYADLLEKRFRAACARVGLAETTSPLATDQFTRPFAGRHQLPLFGASAPQQAYPGEK